MIEDIYPHFEKILITVIVLSGLEVTPVLSLVLLMCIDLFLGSIKTVMVNEVFTFRRLGRGITTKTSILFFIPVMGLMDKGLGMNLSFLSIAGIDVFILNEGISCFTSILSIKTGEPSGNTDYGVKLILVAKDRLTKIVNKLIDSIEKKDFDK